MSVLWPWNSSARYADDCIFFGQDSKKIDAIIARLKKKFDLTVEDTKDDEIDVFAYLGVEAKVDKNANEMAFLLTGLIDKVLRATGMEDCNAKPTPACTTPLCTDAERQANCHGTMLQWLEC